ncbi:hypothetical protein B0H14DRAFT_474343 [Mycena olivaceomarginata]|nr:hypothetical protein B0H14DRAFT_474343 [Mycena olivaceomarginata]
MRHGAHSTPLRSAHVNRRPSFALPRSASLSLRTAASFSVAGLCIRASRSAVPRCLSRTIAYQTTPTHSSSIDDHERIIRRGHLSYASQKWARSENGTFRVYGHFHCARKRRSVTAPALFMRPLFCMRPCSVAGVGAPRPLHAACPVCLPNLRRLVVLSESTVQIEHHCGAADAVC